MSEGNSRELAQRAQDGLEVTLLWDPDTNCVFVRVVDHRVASGFCIAVARHRALDAFYHPYAYTQSHQDSTDRILQSVSANRSA